MSPKIKFYNVKGFDTKAMFRFQVNNAAAASRQKSSRLLFKQKGNLMSFFVGDLYFVHVVK